MSSCFLRYCLGFHLIMMLGFISAGFHHLRITKMLQSFQESTTLRCEMMCHALAQSLEIGAWPVCRKQT
jgi:hypothetical protein